MKPLQLEGIEKPLQYRHEALVQLAKKLIELCDSGKLPKNLTAKHIGKYLIENGRIPMSPVAKVLATEKELEPCEVCPGFPDCLTEHHLNYPRRDFLDDPVMFAYRELPPNKKILCVDSHKKVHKREEPSPKPSREEMIIAILEYFREVDDDFEAEVDSILSQGIA